MGDSRSAGPVDPLPGASATLGCGQCQVVGRFHRSPRQDARHGRCARLGIRFGQLPRLSPAEEGKRLSCFFVHLHEVAGAVL